MKTMKKSRFSRIVMLAMVVCMLACTLLAPAAMAVEANEEVLATKDGVLQVTLVYTGSDGVAQELKTGTAFLINEDTLLTCWHCVQLTDEELAVVTENLDMTPAEIERHLSRNVTLIGDIPRAVTVEESSKRYDVAVLKLEKPIPTKTPLTLRSSADVRQTEDVYAVGFPFLSNVVDFGNDYTTDHVDVQYGTVTKLAESVNELSGDVIDFVLTNCPLSGGVSGGPMVDVDGNVIGICQGAWNELSGSGEVNCAVAIDQIIAILDNMGEEYTLAGDPEPTEDTEPVEDTEPTEADTEPTEVTLPTVDEDTDSSNTTMWIIIGAAGLVVVIIVVVIIIILTSGGKKKGTPAAGTGTYTPPAPPAPPTAPAARPAAPAAPASRPVPPAPGGFAPAHPTAPSQGAGETTVLSGGAGETTVLSQNTVKGGTLLRKKTGETVTINADQFVIGRERKSVNYCIADNSSISRTHVRLTVRGGVTYLCDLNAANGTFVNGVKAMPRQEVALKNGDKITLADEDLEYKI